MKMNISDLKLKELIPYVCTVLLVALMTLSSEMLHEKEIIFPEITALAVGYMVAPKRSWKVNGRRMLLLITTCALAGVGIVRYSGLQVYTEMMIAFSIAQILFMYSGTTFAPFVSAIVLPVMLQTESLIYPAAAFVLTLLVILFHKWFLVNGLREDNEYVPVMLNSKDDWIDAVLRIICVAVIAFAAIKSGFKFIVAPPLLVAFTEFSRPRNKTRNKPIKTIAVITLCSVIGALSRYMLSVKMEMPLTVSAIAATCIMLAVIYFSGMYMPPVGAITMLAMIIPEESIFSYPVQIFVGSCLIVLLSRILFMKRQDRKMYDKEHELEAI